MIEKLRKCQTIYDVADLLEIPAKILTYLLYKLPDSAKYEQICISKKNGGVRHILVPEPRLMSLQRNLSAILYDCKSDIEQKRGNGWSSSYGFERGKGIIENALVHKNKRWVFNIDVLDFFPSINFGRVYSFFQKNQDFSLDRKVATYLAQIACHNGALPQGAPTSPVISNLICGSLDYRLSRFARRNRCDYSRYVDDITFSTNLRDFPADIAVVDQSTQGWTVSDALKGRMIASGFLINDGKTRMSDRRSRQQVTGLVVNKKPNVPRDFYRNTRASIHRLMQGKSVEIDRFCTPFGNNCDEDKLDDGKTNSDHFAILEGRISFCHQIRNSQDKRDEKKKFFHQSAVAKDYADILRLKYFVRGDQPMVMTEGVSDLLYLKAALLRAAKPIDHFVEIDAEGNRKITADFFKFPPKASSILGLSGGSGNIGLFLERYRSFSNRLSNTVMRRPFIILIDNDGGLKSVKDRAKSCFGVDITIDSDEDFYPLCEGLAVVKTPHIGSKKQTCVEHFLDKKALTKPDGRKFTFKEDFDKSKYFGKVELSHHVYDQRDTLDFSAMAKIHDRLALAAKSLK